MQEVVDYKLVVNVTPDLVTSNVKKHMADGWVPSGTVVVFEGALVQAMVKFQEA